jgi:hypothetical protein
MNCLAAYINYQEGEFLSAQITGISGRQWWYIIDSQGTYLATGGQRPGGDDIVIQLTI